MRRSRSIRIIATLGPASNTPEMIGALHRAGADVFRLNMSHGTHADHAEVYRLVREASDASGHGVGIFADLQEISERVNTQIEETSALFSW